MANKKNKSESNWNKGAVQIFSTVMHLFATIHFIFGIATFYNMTIPSSGSMGNSFGGKFKYLTFLNSVID